MAILVDNKEIVSGDETSVKIIYKNILGENFDTEKQHADYLDFIEEETKMAVKGKTVTLVTL